ncbi:polymorphic toxin-type HINT domain-containing protein [Paenibacillus campi]|uniref:polymorphic toxin-type HINT domain-containing protein n=1 Tax=Paenibacillus campi TaxID=3106031 RepID=UPI002AFFE649|nr:polymorphic toxin-type HINT domain-containing protein [Paenibacillus sp. SGZ-1014]
MIETTDNHPFWIEGKGWVTAIELKVGDPLKQSNGHVLAIEQIEVVHHEQKVKVYNFTVTEYHTYFVSDLGIWVHNIDCFNVTVKYLGRNVNVYRGGSSFTVRSMDVKIIDGQVQTNRGISLDVNPSTVEKFGGAYRIDFLPEGLKIIQRGQRVEHFEIVPDKPITLEEFQILLNQIKATKIVE